MAPNVEIMKRMKSNFAERFSIKDLGGLNHILGIRVTRNREERSITLDQTAAVINMLKEYDNTIERDTPLHTKSARKLRTYKEEAEPKTIENYQSIIGSLMYFSRWTRTDISSSVGLLSRFARNPEPEHIQQLMHLLGYLMKNPSLGMQLKNNNTHSKVIMHADADWAEDPEDRKSTSGFVICFEGNPIIWKSTKQDCVSKSTMHAMVTCLTEGEWTCNLLAEIGYDYETPILYCDNQAAIRVISRGDAENFSKHIGVKLRTLHDAVQQELLDLKYICSEDNLADVFTKPLESNKHRKSVALLNMSCLDRGSMESIYPSIARLTLSEKTFSERIDPVYQNAMQEI